MILSRHFLVMSLPTSVPELIKIVKERIIALTRQLGDPVQGGIRIKLPRHRQYPCTGCGSSVKSVAISMQEIDEFLADESDVKTSLAFIMLFGEDMLPSDPWINNYICDSCAVVFV